MSDNKFLYHIKLRPTRGGARFKKAALTADQIEMKTLAEESWEDDEEETTGATPVLERSKSAPVQSSSSYAILQQSTKVKGVKRAKAKVRLSIVTEVEVLTHIRKTMPI